MAKVFFYFRFCGYVVPATLNTLTPCKIGEVWRTNNRKCFYVDGLRVSWLLCGLFTNLLKRFQQFDGEFIGIYMGYAIIITIDCSELFRLYPSVMVRYGRFVSVMFLGRMDFRSKHFLN